MLLADTGIRLGELAHLEVDGIDLDDGTHVAVMIPGHARITTPATTAGSPRHAAGLCGPPAPACCCEPRLIHLFGMMRWLHARPTFTGPVDRLVP